MQTLTFDALPGDRGRARMPHVRRLPRSTTIAPNGRFCR
jgi:hypothetical protein